MHACACAPPVLTASGHSLRRFCCERSPPIAPPAKKIPLATRCTEQQQLRAWLQRPRRVPTHAGAAAIGVTVPFTGENRIKLIGGNGTRNPDQQVDQAPRRLTSTHPAPPPLASQQQRLQARAASRCAVAAQQAIAACAAGWRGAQAAAQRSACALPPLACRGAPPAASVPVCAFVILPCSNSCQSHQRGPPRVHDVLPLCCRTPPGERFQQRSRRRARMEQTEQLAARH